MAKPRFVLEAGLIVDLILVAVNRLVEPNKAMSHTVQGCQRLTRPLTKRSTGGGNGNPFQYSFLENPMDKMKRQKELTPEDEPPRSEGVQHATGEEQRLFTSSSRKNEAAGPKQK